MRNLLCRSREPPHTTQGSRELCVIEPHFPRPGVLAAESSPAWATEIMNEETCRQRNQAPALPAVLELEAGQPDLPLGTPSPPRAWKC